MNRKWLFHIILICVPGWIFGQSDTQSENHNSFLLTECSVQTWNVEGFDHPQVRQISFPIILSTPLSDDVQLTITHSPVFSSWYGNYKLNGLSDTWIQGTYLFPGNTIMVNAGIGMPTGKTRLNNNQFELVQILSHNIFRYQVPVYGQGLCGRIGASAAFPAGKTAIVGVGGQYLFRGKYHPVSYEYKYDTFTNTIDVEFKPGDELTGQVGVDYLLTENLKLLADVEYTAYQKDQQSGREVYKSGAKSLIGCGLYYKYSQQYVYAYLTYRMKNKNEYLQSISLQDSLSNTQGNQFEINVIYKAYTFRDGGLFLFSDVRLFDKNTIKILYNTQRNVNATVIGVGFGIEFPMGENTFGDFRVKLLVGSLIDHAKRNMTGIDASFGVKFLL
jgi:predicted porin